MHVKKVLISKKTVSHLSICTAVELYLKIKKINSWFNKPSFSLS